MLGTNVSCSHSAHPVAPIFSYGLSPSALLALSAHPVPVPTGAQDPGCACHSFFPREPPSLFLLCLLGCEVPAMPHRKPQGTAGAQQGSSHAPLGPNMATKHMGLHGSQYALVHEGSLMVCKPETAPTPANLGQALHIRPILGNRSCTNTYLDSHFFSCWL